MKATQAYYVSLRPDKAFKNMDKYFENEPEKGACTVNSIPYKMKNELLSMKWGFIGPPGDIAPIRVVREIVPDRLNRY